MHTYSGLLIADSGPLIALTKLSLLDLVARMFGRIAVPDIVYKECIEKPELPDAVAIRKAVAVAEVEVLPSLPWSSSLPMPRLDEGELAAISLALHMNATLLIDELRGRRIAQSVGIPVVGVCGLLVACKRSGWLEALAPKLDLLSEYGYFISSALRLQMLVDVGELHNE